MLYIDNPVSCFFQTCPLWNQGCINPSSGRPVQAHKGYLMFFSLWCVSVSLVTGGNWIQFHWECLGALDQWEWGRYKPLLSPDPVFHCFLRLPEKWFLHHRRGRWVGYELCLGLYIWYVLSMLQWVYTIIETVPSICTGLVVSCLHAHIHTHTCTHLHARTFACTYTHTHTHTHTHTVLCRQIRPCHWLQDTRREHGAAKDLHQPEGHCHWRRTVWPSQCEIPEPQNTASLI